ncbi:hypothetical protein Cgig2_018947 [Carnegiea gigantea]|uniref:Uncharacterized protein n=1 Tax=Carnegiea gigantea TaxID=171969 RepID=A0A9Q1JMZ8_9CARY|nr:hypothetical protein Cgig2_018947 [Carnegiea gigantea]
MLAAFIWVVDYAYGCLSVVRSGGHHHRPPHSGRHHRTSTMPATPRRNPNPRSRNSKRAHCTFEPPPKQSTTNNADHHPTLVSLSQPPPHTHRPQPPTANLEAPNSSLDLASGGHHHRPPHPGRHHRTSTMPATPRRNPNPRSRNSKRAHCTFEPPPKQSTTNNADHHPTLVSLSQPPPHTHRPQPPTANLEAPNSSLDLASGGHHHRPPHSGRHHRTSTMPATPRRNPNPRSRNSKRAHCTFEPPPKQSTTNNADHHPTLVSLSQPPPHAHRPQPPTANLEAPNSSLDLRKP